MAYYRPWGVQTGLRSFGSGLPSHAHAHLPFDSMWLSTQHGVVKDLRFLGKTWGSDTGRRGLWCSVRADWTLQTHQYYWKLESKPSRGSGGGVRQRAVCEHLKSVGALQWRRKDSVCTASIMRISVPSHSDIYTHC